MLTQAQLSWGEVARPVLRPAEMEFLNHLRFEAMRCRSKPRSSMFEACALLKCTPAASRDAYVQALARSVDEALNTRMRWHGPGVEETSFDEAWILSLAKSIAAKREDSVSFLLQSRVAPEHRRLLRFLTEHVILDFKLV